MKQWTCRLILYRIVFLSAVLASLALSACSPWYVIRAGWEEAGILWRRQDIEKLIQSDEVDETAKRKLALVLEAREYAKTVGLEPKGSFTQYTKINRDVLVWVLSAAPKTELNSYTWWFPIVGRVPYKGFFEKEDAVSAAERLRADGHDIYVRPSAAFSTLGWFNDPLLSTLLKHDEISLANTVIHEILHNTVWIPNHASFNETLANIVGTLGAQEFFKAKFGEASTQATGARDRWHDELIYAQFLDRSAALLREFYASVKKSYPEELDPKDVPEEVLTERQRLFQTLVQDWDKSKAELRTKAYAEAAIKMNNAVIISQLVYLDRPSQFLELYELTGCNLPGFIREMVALEEEFEDGGREEKDRDPYVLLAERAAALKEARAAEGLAPGSCLRF